MRMGSIQPRRSLSIFCFLIGFILGWLFLGGNEKAEMEDIQMAENWERKLVEQKPQQSQQQLGAKLDRPRFVQSELGIRQQLLILLLARSPSITPALFALLSPKVPIRTFVIPQSGPIPELPPNAQPISIRPGPIALLSAIANQSLHDSADWFFLLSDSTFLNLFHLQKLISSLQWNSPLALGHGEGDYCHLDGGILLSAPALHSLIQNRHLCHGLLPNGRNENSALETCIRLAANLTCKSKEGIGMRWWRIGADMENGSGMDSIHDQIGHLSMLDGFNMSTTISGLLSERDVHSLEEHFLHVELTEINAQIGELEFELGEMGENDGIGWPIGVQIAEKPPNRFQVPIWEMLNNDWKLFGNNPDENYIEISGEEWTELMEEAMKRVAPKCGEIQPKMRQAYRKFSPGRGIDYFMDLECAELVERVQLIRPIESTKLMEMVPFVKEDRELAILVPVDSANQVRGIRPLLRRILAICLQTSLDSPKMRILVATRQMDAKLIRLLAADLGEMKRRCHSTLDSTLLLLKPDPFSQIPIQVAALDEAVDRFGHQNLFLLMSPFADFQADFLDRTRLNAIRNFQISFPIPFAEFNQFVAGLTPKEAEQFVVHKTRGRFDTENWDVVALFGDDFARARSRHSSSSPPSSILQLFLGQSRLHILRQIEPSLRIRPHPWVCGQHQRKCERRRRLGLGTRAQLARLVLAPETNNKDGQ